MRSEIIVLIACLLVLPATTTFAANFVIGLGASQSSHLLEAVRSDEMEYCESTVVPIGWLEVGHSPCCSKPLAAPPQHRSRGAEAPRVLRDLPTRHTTILTNADPQDVHERESLKLQPIVRSLDAFLLEQQPLAQRFFLGNAATLARTKPPRLVEVALGSFQLPSFVSTPFVVGLPHPENAVV